MTGSALVEAFAPYKYLANGGISGGQRIYPTLEEARAQIDGPGEIEVYQVPEAMLALGLIEGLNTPIRTIKIGNPDEIKVTFYPAEAVAIPVRRD